MHSKLLHLIRCLLEKLRMLNSWLETEAQGRAHYVVLWGKMMVWIQTFIFKFLIVNRELAQTFF